jgi:SAM-dependent methyltransferase
MSIYEGLEAKLYDEFWRDDVEDIAFCLDLVRSRGGRVLEVACGTGRVLIPLKKAGLDVIGIDSSPAMLELCRKKVAEAGLEIELHCCRMEDFRLEKRFTTICVPAFSFQLVNPPEAADRALRRFAGHLDPGGQLVLSMFVPFVEPHEEGEGLWHLRKEVVRESDGARIACLQSNTFDTRRRLLHVKNRYEIYDPHGVLSQSETGEMLIQWYAPNELAIRLRDAGFDDVRIIGDDEPDDDGNAVLHLVATKTPSK